MARADPDRRQPAPPGLDHRPILRTPPVACFQASGGSCKARGQPVGAVFVRCQSRTVKCTPRLSPARLGRGGDPKVNARSVTRSQCKAWSAFRNQSVDPLGGLLGQGNPNHTTHRVAPERCRRELQVIQHGEDVIDHHRPDISSTIVRLVALTMLTSVDQDDPVVRLQRVHVPEETPELCTQRVAMLKDEGWSRALNFVMDVDASVEYLWH